MDIQVFVRNVEEPEALRSFAADKLNQVLDRFTEHTLSAVMRLEDETGPHKRGVDKVCSIDVKLRSGDIIIKEHGDDFLGAVHTALDRLRTALSRQQGKFKRGVGEG